MASRRFNIRLYAVGPIVCFDAKENICLAVSSAVNRHSPRCLFERDGLKALNYPNYYARYSGRARARKTGRTPGNERLELWRVRT